MQRLRLALIGCGVTTQTHHAPALARLAERFEVVAVVDQDPDAVQRTIAALKTQSPPTTQDLAEVLENPSVDAALVVLPHHLHLSVVDDLLNQGKHVLVEKPFTHNAEEALRLCMLADKYGLHLAVGHCQRFSPAAAGIKALLDRQDIGTVFAAQATALQYLPDYAGADRTHWLYDPEKAGGGVVMSVCVHKLDLLRYLLGEVASVSATCDTSPDASANPRAFEWTAAITLRFDNGAIASVFGCYKARADRWQPEELLILGERGTVRASGWRNYDLHTPGRTFVRHTPEHPGEWIAQLEAFHEGILGSTPNPAAGTDALHTMTLIDAIYKSAEHGGAPVQPVRHPTVSS
ncbi:MAG: Gfo/Idh/MocA family oxidoreductase [Planctomycetota bacterium]